MSWALLSCLFSAIIVSFVARDAYAWLSRLQRLILKCAAARLPVEHRDNYFEEWTAEVERLPAAELSRTVMALSLLIGAGRFSREITGEAPVLAQMGSRFFEATSALIAVFLFWPIFLGVALLVARDAGPIFWGSQTVGKHGRAFRRYKFRTMRLDAVLRAEVTANLASGAQTDPRITPIGDWLRRTSIDELPMLLNVVRGEMGLVGIRAVHMSVYEQLSDEDRREYSKYKPGIVAASSLCKVRFEEAFHIDFAYMRSRNILKDLVLLGLTVFVLLTAENVVCNTGVSYRSDSWIETITRNLIFGRDGQ